MGLSLDKLETEAPALVPLAKKASFSLNKFGLEDQTAEVELALDYSASMSRLYESGQIQQLGESVLALATQLDDDGQVPTWFFDNGCQLMGDIDLGSYTGAIDRFRQRRGMGGTEYAPVIREIVKKHKKGSGLFRKKTGLPKYVLFLTDGFPNDPAETEKALVDASEYPIFWKFISLGMEIDFLRGLDNLEGRKTDNAHYVAINGLSELTSSQLYDLLLMEWPSYLTSARQAGILGS